MQITTLGASGGLEQQGTSAFHLPPATLLDAGTGVAALPFKAMNAIRHILLTHAHIDHIASLPLLADTLFETLVGRQECLTVFALPEVIGTLQQHIFNGQIWPDFTRLPSNADAVLRFSPLTYWEAITLPGADESLSITPFPVTHGVPACGFLLEDGDSRIAYSGDTGLSDTTIGSLNRAGPLDILIIECGFANGYDNLASLAHHLTPNRLTALVNQLDTLPKALWISHLKPTQHRMITQELRDALPPSLHWSLLP